MGVGITGKFGRITASLLLAGSGWGQQPKPGAVKTTQQIQTVPRSVVNSARLEIHPEKFSGLQVVTLLNDDYDEGHVRIWRGVFKSPRWQLPPEAVEFTLFDPANPNDPKVQKNWEAALAKFNIRDPKERERLSQWVATPVTKGRRFEIESAKGTERYPVGVPASPYYAAEFMSDEERAALMKAEAEYYKRQYEEAYRSAAIGEKSEPVRRLAKSVVTSQAPGIAAKVPTKQITSKGRGVR